MRREIRALLERAKVPYEILPRPASTAMADDPVRQLVRAELARVLALSIDGSPVLAVLPADARIDWRALRRAYDVRRVTVTTAQELAIRAPGWDPLPPFGELIKMPTLADPGLEQQEKIVFDLGDDLVRVAARDYFALVKPRILSIGEAAREAA